MENKIDTRALGLDAGLNFIRWLTGTENLHYGLWDGIEVSAGNLRQAQDAYSDLLFSFMPAGRHRILDIGGGAGTTAAKLQALGHEVEIVIPSSLLAERCRANAPGAKVHHCRFEDFETANKFDLCLFSESFQYIGLKVGLPKALSMLSENGEILIADCFRSPEFGSCKGGLVGGGHPIKKFRTALEALPLDVAMERDITALVSPSIDLEQGLFNVIGSAVGLVDKDLSDRRPRLRWLLNRALRLFVNERRRFRLNRRLNEQHRTSEAFEIYNQYLILRLTQRG